MFVPWCTWAFSTCGQQSFSSQWLLMLLTIGSRAHMGFSSCSSRVYKDSIVVAHGLRCPVTCGIFSDQGWNPCLLHQQADSLPQSHQGRPVSGLSYSPNLYLGFVSFLQSVMSCPTSWMSYFMTRFSMNISISYQVLGVDGVSWLSFLQWMWPIRDSKTGT